MKIIDCKQGSDEWHRLKLGVASASKFDKILTKTGKLSASSTDYMYQLVAESIIGQPCDNVQSSFMERGTELEASAVDLYNFENDVAVNRVGFCMMDSGLVGCSPDGLVGEDGGLEIKCPSAKIHVKYLLDNDALVQEYRLQVQGSLYVTGRKWWDLMAYNPVMPAVTVRCYPDPDFISLLESAMNEFIDNLQDAREKIAKIKLVEIPIEDWCFGEEPPTEWAKNLK